MLVYDDLQILVQSPERISPDISSSSSFPCPTTESLLFRSQPRFPPQPQSLPVYPISSETAETSKGNYTMASSRIHSWQLNEPPPGATIAIVLTSVAEI
jgi:hypothetical protein